MLEIVFLMSLENALGCLRLCSWCLWKALDKEGCMGLVPFGMLEIVFLVSLESSRRGGVHGLCSIWDA